MPLIRDIAKRFVPDAEVVYCSEECGNGIFYTNDPIYFGKYYIDVWKEEVLPIQVESLFDAEPSTVTDFLQNLFDTEISDIDTLLNMLEETPYRDGVSINAWRELSIDDAEG